MNDVPDHVPPDLVRPFLIADTAPAVEDPFDVLVPRMHEGPDIFFAPRSYAFSGTWVMRKAALQREILLNNDDFSVFKGEALAIEAFEKRVLVGRHPDDPDKLKSAPFPPEIVEKFMRG